MLIFGKRFLLFRTHNQRNCITELTLNQALQFWFSKNEVFFQWSMEDSTMHCASLCIIYFSLFPDRLLLLNLNLGAPSKDSSGYCREGQQREQLRNFEVSKQFCLQTKSLTSEATPLATQILSGLLCLILPPCQKSGLIQ